jgi:TolB-like protein/Tfp pilus assembly protein PilF
VDTSTTRAELDKILASEGFANADSLSRFLRFVVDQSLAGQGDRIKEYVIGVQVFGRGESFDPRVDPIVRVQAGKLRNKLKEYYEAAGAGDAVTIELPKGTYAPVFRAAPAPLRSRNRLALAATILFVPGAFTAWTFLRYLPKALPAGPPAEVSSIAVLPFVNMSAEKDQDYFCDGITEEISNVLSNVEGLRVTARTSAFTFRGKMEDVRQIGARLGVRTVLEGSVRKSGDLLRITAQLVSAKDGYHLWSETYERPLKDVFAIQDEIARAIASALRIRLASGGPSASASRYTSNVELYDLYLKGRYYLNSFARSSVETAKTYFDKAIEKDPNFAPAWVGLAEVYRLQGDSAYAAPKEMMRKTREAAERALRIDDTLADAHAVLGASLSAFEWDWTGAARELDRAIQLNPNLGRAYILQNSLYMHEGRFAEMERALRRAQLLDPLSTANGAKFVQLYYYSRQYDRVVDYCRSASTGWMVYYLGRVYADQGRLTEGIELLERAYKMREGPGKGFGMLANYYARAGRRVDAFRLINEAKALSRQQYISPVSLAQAYIGLGDKDQAFAWLDKGFEERDTVMTSLRVEPAFDPIRSDARFAALLKRMRL